MQKFSCIGKLKFPALPDATGLLLRLDLEAQLELCFSSWMCSWRAQISFYLIFYDKNNVPEL